MQMDGVYSEENGPTQDLPTTTNLYVPESKIKPQTSFRVATKNTFKNNGSTNEGSRCLKV
jgi:hypothetical protein